MFLLVIKKMNRPLENIHNFQKNCIINCIIRNKKKCLVLLF